MTRDLVTFSEHRYLFKGHRCAVDHRISGAPVIDASGQLVGVLSESDCLRSILSGQLFLKKLAVVSARS